MNKIPFEKASHKMEHIRIVVLKWHFKVKLGKKQNYFSSLTLLSKDENSAQMINVINKYVKSWKLCWGKRRLRGWKKTRLTWKMDGICERAVGEVEFSNIFHYILKFWLHSPTSHLRFGSMKIYNRLVV